MNADVIFDICSIVALYQIDRKKKLCPENCNTTHILQTNTGLDRIIIHNVYSTHQNTYTMCSKNSNVYTIS